MKPLPVSSARRKSSRIKHENPKKLDDRALLKECSVPLEHLPSSIFESGMPTVHLFPAGKINKNIMTKEDVTIIYVGGVAVGYHHSTTDLRESPSHSNRREEEKEMEKPKKVIIQSPPEVLQQPPPSMKSSSGKRKASKSVDELRFENQSGGDSDKCFKENMNVLEDRNNNNHFRKPRITHDSGDGKEAVNNSKTPESQISLEADLDLRQTTGALEQSQTCTDDPNPKKPLETVHLNTRIETTKKSLGTEAQVQPGLMTTPQKELQIKVRKMELFRSPRKSDSPPRSGPENLTKDKMNSTQVDKLKMKPVVKLVRLEMGKMKRSSALETRRVEAPELEVVVERLPEPVWHKYVQIKHKFCNICGKSVSSEDELNSFLELDEVTLRRFACLTCHQRCVPTERTRHKAGCFLTHDEVYYDGWEDDVAAKHTKKKLEKFRMLACQDCIDTAKKT